MKRRSLYRLARRARAPRPAAFLAALIAILLAACGTATTSNPTQRGSQARPAAAASLRPALPSIGYAYDAPSASTTAFLSDAVGRANATNWSADPGTPRLSNFGLADRCEKVTQQINQRVKGEKITDRLISLWDPDARPIRKGKLGKPNEFGYVDQLCEITANTKPGARGFILAPQSQIGNPVENTLLPSTAQELRDLEIKLKEIMVDGAFATAATNTALEDLTDTVHIAGRQEEGSTRTRRRRRRYRTGMEGRISHLKRGYGLRRSRLKGDEGHRIWDGWATLTYNAETYTTL